jgi:hypothetical protein
MRYDRMTLVAKEGGERMTIDNGLVFSTHDGMEIVNKDLFVVETKSANGNGIADKVLRSMHHHPQKHCSKYCVGTAVLTPEIKTNNFKMVLRKLMPSVPALGLATH